jgi:hypothetical protein
MAQQFNVIQPDDDGEDGLPIRRRNWRVEPQANLSHNEMAAYRKFYHAPRMLSMAAAGLKGFGDNAAQLSDGDEDLAATFTAWESRLANRLIVCVERYLDSGGYYGGTY